MEQTIEDVVIEHNGVSIKVLRDYDNIFLGRVKAAIDMNIKNHLKNTDKRIIVNSGPYRPYCMHYEIKDNTISLDFYSASRVFGYEHSIKDIADVIKL